MISQSKVASAYSGSLGATAAKPEQSIFLSNGWNHWKSAIGMMNLVQQKWCLQVPTLVCKTVALKLWNRGGWLIIRITPELKTLQDLGIILLCFRSPSRKVWWQILSNGRGEQSFFKGNDTFIIFAIRIQSYHFINARAVALMGTATGVIRTIVEKIVELEKQRASIRPFIRGGHPESRLAFSR